MARDFDPIFSTNPEMLRSRRTARRLAEKSPRFEVRNFLERFAPKQGPALSVFGQKANSVTDPIPGPETLSLFPSSSTDPESMRSASKIRRAVSVRPAPTNPVSPTISPARKSKETPLTREPRPRLRTANPTSPATLSRNGNSFSKLRRPYGRSFALDPVPSSRGSRRELRL